MCKTSGSISRSQNISGNLSYIRPLTSESYEFLVSIVKNNGVCQIPVKEPTKAQKSAIAKFWRKRRDGRGSTLGSFRFLVCFVVAKDPVVAFDNEIYQQQYQFSYI